MHRKNSSKILLVGNGFTSHLIDAYKNNNMKTTLSIECPELIKKVDSVWADISAITIGVYDDINDLNYPYIVLDSVWLAIRDEEGIVPHSTHIEVDNLSSIKKPIINCFVQKYGIDIQNSNRIFKQFFMEESSVLRFYLLWPKVNAIEPFYALVKLAFRLNIINQIEKNALVQSIKRLLRNNERFYFKDIPEAASLEGIKDFLGKYRRIFTTNYDQLLEVSGQRIIHLHGSFLEDEIILGIDDIEKQNKIKKYQKRLDLLQNIDCDEIHIFGYSGKNDIHINTAIRDNGCKIVYYCLDNIKNKVAPTKEDFKIDELHNEKFHDCVRWSFGIPRDTKCDFVFKDRDEIWAQIYGKK